MKHLFATFLFSVLLLKSYGQTDTTQPSSKLPIHFAPKQSESHTFPNRLWVDVSGQLAFPGHHSLFGIGAGGNLHYLNRNRRHFQIRYNFVQSIEILSFEGHRISDVGYMAGWLRARKYSLMEFSIGIGYVGGYKYMEPFATVGVPFEADLKFMASNYGGLGLSVKGNLNPKLSYVGLGVELTLNGPN